MPALDVAIQSPASGLAGVRRLTVARGLAVLGVALIIYQGWTLVGWLGDGPHQITAFRTHGRTTWYAARVIEGLVLVSTAGFVARVLRERRRTGRLGTDGLLIVGMFTAAFWDPVYNWVTPAWLYSSDFLNVNDWFGHAPGVLNPDAGRMPWPVVIVLVGYPLWGVGFAILINHVMGAVQWRRPGIRRRTLAAIAFVTAAAITATAFTIFQAFGLMDAPGYRLALLGDQQWLFFAYSGGVVFGSLACIRWFLGGRRDSIPPLESVGAPTRILATIAACQIIVILGWGVLTVPFSLASSPYPRTSRDLLNRLCNAPGVTGTRYGPCPGAPGATLRVR